MGNQKLKWTLREEEALKTGVARHGVGKWKNILNDPDFASVLSSRSNIDLKDKWRNMIMSSGSHGSRDKAKSSRAKAITFGALSAPRASNSSASFAEDDSFDDPTKDSPDGKSAPRYSAMIFDALSSIKDPNGSDLGAIAGFIEQRHEVPNDFRRLLSLKMRRLVLQGKLEKVHNCYKMKDDAALGTNTLTTRHKDPRIQNSGIIVSRDPIEDAVRTASYRIAEAENKSSVAAEAVKEAERISKLAEDTESMLQLAKEICERCSQGEIILVV